jgi:hypothetical protein
MEMIMRRAALLVVLGTVLAAGSLAGMDWGISARAGVLTLRQKGVQDMYGTGLPVGLAAWSGWKNWRLSVGFEYLSERGQALPLSGGEEEFPLRLKVTSIPSLLFYQIDAKDVFIALGGGASYAMFKESWEDLDIVTEGKKWGPVLSLLAGYRLGPRMSLFGDLRYEPMPTGKSSLLVEEVKLGGLKLGAGVMLHL